MTPPSLIPEPTRRNHHRHALDLVYRLDISHTVRYVTAAIPRSYNTLSLSLWPFPFLVFFLEML